MQRNENFIVIVHEGPNLLLVQEMIQGVLTYSAISGKRVEQTSVIDCAKERIRLLLGLIVYRSDFEYDYEFVRRQRKGTPNETVINTQVYTLKVKEGTAKENSWRARNYGLTLACAPPAHLPILVPMKPHHRTLFQEIGLWPQLRLIKTA